MPDGTVNYGSVSVDPNDHGVGSSQEPVRKAEDARSSWGQSNYLNKTTSFFVTSYNFKLSTHSQLEKLKKEAEIIKWDIIGLRQTQEELRTWGKIFYYRDTPNGRKRG